MVESTSSSKTAKVVLDVHYARDYEDLVKNLNIGSG